MIYSHSQTKKEGEKKTTYDMLIIERKSSELLP